MKNEIVRLGIILFLITAIAAGILAISNDITAEIIVKTEEEASSGPEVAGAVIPGAVKFEALDAEIISKIAAANEKFVDAKIVLDSAGEQLGYAIRTLSVVPGYGGDMELYVGLSMDGKLEGIKVLALQETPGLGTNVEKKSFQDQFVGKTSDMVLQVVKVPSSNENEINALAGATFSTLSFTSAVNNAMSIYENFIKPGSDASEIEAEKELTEAEMAALLVPNGFSFEAVDGELIETIKSLNEKFINLQMVKDEAGDHVGYAISTLSQSKGYNGDMEITVGIDLSDLITGIMVDKINETPGLGTKVGEKEFKGQFIGKEASNQFKIVLNNAFSDEEIDTVAGATMSSNSFTSAVNNALSIYAEFIKK
jgi:Na+-translocating ferredoxin:NAD+ oxidoreductase subunit G